MRPVEPRSPNAERNLVMKPMQAAIAAQVYRQTTPRHGVRRTEQRDTFYESLLGQWWHDDNPDDASTCYWRKVRNWY
jgi:hypothetical protein